MKNLILIAGATGMIGKKLSQELYNYGYQIISITRNIEKSKYVVPWCDNHIDYLNNKELDRYIAQSYAVINLAGTSIAAKRWTESYKREIINSRIETTKLLVSAINNSLAKPQILINTSAIGYYGNTSDQLIDESSSNGNDFLATVTSMWEKEAKQVDPTVRLIIPRLGVVFDSKEGAFNKMTLPFKYCLGGVLGNGNQWMSWIHIDDIIKIFVWLLSSSVRGTINCTSPYPITMKEYAKLVSRALHKPYFLTIPALVLRLVLGESSEMITNSCRAMPKTLLANEFQYKYDELEKALQALLN